MTLRITNLYPEYQCIQTNTQPLSNEKAGSQAVKTLSFTRTSIDPELYADVMQIRQNCAQFTSAVYNLNARTDDKQKYKPVFGVLKNKDGKPSYPVNHATLSLNNYRLFEFINILII